MESTAGEMVNLMSVDAQRLMDLVTYLNVLWSSPLVIVIAMYFLFDVMGPSTLAGVGVLILLVPFNLVVTKMARKLQVWRFYLPFNLSSCRGLTLILTFAGRIKLLSLKIMIWCLPIELFERLAAGRRGVLGTTFSLKIFVILHCYSILRINNGNRTEWSPSRFAVVQFC